MSNYSRHLASRREFIGTTGRIAAASALAGVALPQVHAAGSDLIQLALVGCGNRGTGAVADAFSTSDPVKLVAMADVFDQRLNSSFEKLNARHAEKLDVPRERKFIGLDAYRHAMDCLRPGDVVLLTTPPAFRWVHFSLAIQKGLNVFMEKPVTVDGPTSRKMLELGERASEKNLKVGVGLMSRHSRALQELFQRIQGGEIGELLFLRGYRMHGPGGSAFSTRWPGQPAELLWQIQRFHSFLWASGGCFSDFYIHHIDQLCWMKNSWPVKAQALGGRHYRSGPDGSPCVDQNFDIYSVEYTFADGAKLYLDGRCIVGCNEIYSSYAHGSKGMAIVAGSGDCGLPCSLFRGQVSDPSKLLWTSKVPQNDQNPYVNEWKDLMDAIRNDKPYSELKRGVQASLVASMGRMAAHTGQEISYEQMLNCQHEFAPQVDKLDMTSAAPLLAGPDGKYPAPMPGITKDREY